MEIKKSAIVYFSATNTTQKIVEAIAEGTGMDNIHKFDITKGQEPELNFDKDDLVIFGLPVYAGRIPAISVNSLNKFKGNHTPAIIVCVYGNRDYDDALLELYDVVSGNGFSIISAGVFIGQHSIFPRTALGRPDREDLDKARNFGRESVNKVAEFDDPTLFPNIEVKGNFPYKIPNPIPLVPKGDRKCNGCGKCVQKCPVQAIDIKTPRRTDKSLCIACAGCIKVCPQNARSFRGIVYLIASRKFTKAYAIRKEPETTLG